MISLLAPQRRDNIHSFVLQVILKLAGLVPQDFKAQVAALSEYERKNLEISIQDSKRDTTPQPTQQPQTAQPLKIDLSRYV